MAEFLTYIATSAAEAYATVATTASSAWSAISTTTEAVTSEAGVSTLTSPNLIGQVAGFVGNNFGLIATGFSAVSQGMAQASAAKAASQSLTSQANQLQAQARQEQVIGLQQSNEIKQRTLLALARNNARNSAAGIDPNSGTPLTINQELQRQSDQQLSVVRDNADQASLSDAMGSANKSMDASYALASGNANVRSTLFESVAKAANRGGVALT